MNLHHNLVLKHFFTRHNIRPFQTVLNLSQQPLDFKVKTIDYYQTKCTQLPFVTQSVDFIFSREQDTTRMFKNPFVLTNECLRVSRRGGIIQCTSPLETVILGCKQPYLMWPDLYTNSLCILPYEDQVFVRNRTKWLDLINYNPLYLSCFYYWEQPLDLNIKVFPHADMDSSEYTNLVNDILHESVTHTQQFIEH
ncbi:methyltransferase domain-containing protein [bacterium]|nr:methyltransferase domain-containing protein [Candidatus Elulimicrobium humile]